MASCDCGGAANCNNSATPAIIGQYLHVSTMAGKHYVLRRSDGQIVREVDCHDPILSSPVTNGQRVYVATVGARIYALEADGRQAWTWDFVKEVIGFEGDRWKGEDWLKARPDRVTWRDHFVCSRELCLLDKTVVIPAGGRTVFLSDAGDRAQLSATGEIPQYDGSEFPATFGQSADAAGNVYVQWHRRDNAGRVEVLTLKDGKVQTQFVEGTQTAIHLPGLLSFAGVSVRRGDIYRVRPEQGMGLCKHRLDSGPPQVLCPAPSISSPVLTQQHAIYGGMDGQLHIVPLAGGTTQHLSTAFGCAITAPVAAADERIVAACEDGYIYVFAAGGRAALPTRSLEIDKIRSPLSGPWADPNTIGTPITVTSVRRTAMTKVCNRRCACVGCVGAKGPSSTCRSAVAGVSTRTQRKAWSSPASKTRGAFCGDDIGPMSICRSRRHCMCRASCLFPSGHQTVAHAMPGRSHWQAIVGSAVYWLAELESSVSAGSLWQRGHLRIGLRRIRGSRYRETIHFKGTPSQRDDGAEVMSWIYSNDNPYYPKDNRPLLWAWDLETGKLVWQKDFSDQGRGGNDCGICLMDGKLFYSTFFGYSASFRARRGLPPANNGMTACLDPQTGEVLWLTNDYYVTAKCTLSGRDGRLYIGGNNRPNESTDSRFVWCLDAKDGSLVWKSDPITSALNVVSVGKNYIFSNALRGRGNVFDRASGKVVGGVDHNYACCRFTLSEPFILGANMDMIDLSQDSRLVSTGPAIDSRECLGAVVSNGRIFYTSQASGFIVSQSYGPTAQASPLFSQPAQPE